MPEEPPPRDPPAPRLLAIGASTKARTPANGPACEPRARDGDEGNGDGGNGDNGGNGGNGDNEGNAGVAFARAVRRLWPWFTALVLVVLAAFHPLWRRGESLMSAMGARGMTLRGPVGANEEAHRPLADGVAAYIDEPLAVFTAELLARGEAPVWNPHDALGVPLYGNWQSAIPNPLRWPVLLWPESSWTFDLTYLLRLVVAGAGALLLALRLGLPPPAAFGAGVAFALTGYFVRYVSMHHLNGEVWLPWLWLAADRLAERATAGRVLALTFVTFAIVTGGNPQPALLAALGTAAFGVWRWRRGNGDLHAWLRVAACTAPAVLLASSYWLAGLEYVRESVHHHSSAFGRDAYTAAGALGFVLPVPYTIPAGDGRLPPYDLVAPYFGVVPLVLAAIGLGAGLGRSAFLWLVLLLTAGKIGGLPGIEWLGSLPGLSQTKLFKYAYPLAALALAVLCGAGITAAVAGQVTARRLWRGIGLVAATTALLVAAGSLAAKASPLLAFDGTPGLLLRVAIVAALAAALRRWHEPGQASHRALACVGLLALELIVSTPGAWLPRHEPFAAPEYVKALPRDRSGYRTFGAFGVLMPNQNAVLGIADVRLHDGVFPRRYGKFVKRFLNPNVRHWPVFTGEDLGERPANLLPEAMAFAALLLPQAAAHDVQPSVTVDLTAPVPASYLDLLNVRYLLLPRFEQVVQWVRGWPQERYRVVHDDEDAIVVERKSALPRAFFPERIVEVPDEDEALDRLAAPDFDGRKVAYVELGAGGHGGDGSATPPATAPRTGSARAQPAAAASEARFQVQASDPGWLVVSIYPYPGMRAYVDDAPTPLRPANACMSAVHVPFGRHELRLAYEPTWVGLASLLSAAGAVLLLGLCIASARANVMRT